ncbi:MAG TPA: hypothetical protein PKJ97_01340, partial [Candidatus Bilamarchaeaceae archaeon]|nr:hypothetical protein [Candidatus Bilamarchaeaceae archaeon]
LLELQLRGILHPALGGAETFEPQTGEYKGRIGADYYLCRDGERECGKRPGEIVFIIADNDLYHFEDGKWIGYQLYGERAEDLARRIRAFTG